MNLKHSMEDLNSEISADRRDSSYSNLVCCSYSYCNEYFDRQATLTAKT